MSAPVPEPFQEFLEEDGKVEIPEGSKDTRAVDPRQVYDFEIVMATGMENPEGFREANIAQDATVMDGIGEAALNNRFDMSGEDAASPGSFPRTGKYIRNHLVFQGPSYIFELHKDLLLYTQFVNWYWDYEIKTGTYNSTRRYFKMLKQISDLEEFPTIVRTLTDQEAEEMGLQVEADHPSIENETAPWLANRSYYVISEDGSQSNVWKDPRGVLY